MQTRGGRSSCSQMTGWGSRVLQSRLDCKDVSAESTYSTSKASERRREWVRLRTPRPRGASVLSVVLKNRSAKPGWPRSPPTAPLNLDASRRPPSEELLQLCLLRPEHRSLAASTRSSPKATLWCEGLGPETRGLHLCFHQSVGTARSHLRLKADDRARSCGGSDSCWETSLGPNTPQLRSEDRVSESRV